MELSGNKEESLAQILQYIELIETEEEKNSGAVDSVANQMRKLAFSLSDSSTPNQFSPDKLKIDRKTNKLARKLSKYAKDGASELGFNFKRYDFSEDISGFGWYEPQINVANLNYRWSGISESASIAIEDFDNTLKWIGLRGHSATPSQMKDEKFHISLDNIATPFVIVPDKKRVYIWIPVTHGSSLRELSIHVKERIIPSEEGINNDKRRLGFSVVEIIEAHSTP